MAIYKQVSPWVLHRFIQTVFSRYGCCLVEGTSVSHAWGWVLDPAVTFFPLFLPSIHFVSFLLFVLFYLRHLLHYLFTRNYFPLHDTQRNRTNFSFSNSRARVNQVADLWSCAVAPFWDCKIVCAPSILSKAVHSAVLEAALHWRAAVRVTPANVTSRKVPVSAWWRTWLLVCWLLVCCRGRASGQCAVWIALAILFRLIPLVVVLWWL